MSAFCIACILTLAFIAPLSDILKVSICSFSVALPFFILIRVSGEHRVQYKIYVLLTPAFAIMFVGWVTLLWGIYRFAAVSFILASFVAFGFLRWALRGKN